MKRLILALALVLAATAAFAGKSEAETYRDLAQDLAQIHQAVARQAGKYPRETVRQVAGENGYGSAVVIQPGLVLSARHVAVNKGLRIGTIPLTLVSAPEEKPGEDTDVAALKAPGIECPCAELAESDPQLDEPVFTLGYAGGEGFPLMVVPSETQYVGWVNVEGGIINGPRIVFNSPRRPGASGGGLFVKRNNRWQLVGIYAEASPYGHGFAVPISVIRKWLEGGL